MPAFGILSGKVAKLDTLVQGISRSIGKPLLTVSSIYGVLHPGYLSKVVFSKSFGVITSVSRESVSQFTRLSTTLFDHGG